jgi:hypothetical protein
MKALDSICAWALFGWALTSIVMIEIRHPTGAVLDVPVLWLVVAILNSLRIRHDTAVRELRLFCVAVNIIVLMIEIVRSKMFGAWTLVAALLILFETLFSIFRKPAPACLNPNIPPL